MKVGINRIKIGNKIRKIINAFSDAYLRNVYSIYA